MDIFRNATQVNKSLGLKVFGSLSISESSFSQNIDKFSKNNHLYLYILEMIHHSLILKLSH